jgi:hypothetical protein
MTRKPQGPTRGESDVEIEVSEYEDDERVEYIEAENTVRYVAGWRHTNHEEVRNGEPPDREPVYGTTPFERWATTRCLTAAGRAAVEHISDELRTDEVSSGIAGDIDGKGPAAFVSVETVLDRAGNPVDVTSVEFEPLVAATPSSIQVIYHLADQEFRTDVSVYACHRVTRQQ